LPGVENAADTGLIPCGLYRNRDNLSEKCDLSDNVKQIYKDIFLILRLRRAHISPRK
jgi:hypothetical protein